MKRLCLILCLLPLAAYAQKPEHREATPEERKILLPKESEEKLKLIGTDAAMHAERHFMSEGLLRHALRHGKLDEVQIKGYIQKLTNQGLTEKQIAQELNGLSQKYFAELQLSKLNEVLPMEKQKAFEEKFNALGDKEEAGKLGHEELDRELSALDAEISKSELTKENEKLMLQLRSSLDSTFKAHTFVKSPQVIDARQFSEIKVMVPRDFSLAGIQKSNPLCLSDSQIPLDQQLTDLTAQMNSIGSENHGKKPLIKEVYFAWGWNRTFHSDADATFTTKDGTFTIHDAHGIDRPSKFDPKIYFNPAYLSIPQYNVELGVMFSEKWGMELKQDHMKWVFDRHRPYEMSGDYNRQVMIKNDNPTSDWDAVMPVSFSVAKERKDASWLGFEHTDGYNYVSAGAVYKENLFKTKNENFKIDARFGAGAGLMIPKTKVMYHQDERWQWKGRDNKFHVAGSGAHAEAKLRFTFWKYAFLQASTRGTYIKVKDALVYDGTDERLEHDPIMSVQFIGQFGTSIPVGPKKKKD
jgi:hypothetical protein